MLMAFTRLSILRAVEEGAPPHGGWKFQDGQDHRHGSGAPRPHAAYKLIDVLDMEYMYCF